MVILFCTAVASVMLSLAVAFATDIWLTERIAIAGSWIGLQRSYNPGIAFGLHLGPFQDIIICAALALLVWVAWKNARTWYQQAGFGLVIGGGAANVVDRLLDGVVTDMVQVGTFPIFNAADACINVGAAILLLELALEWWKTRNNGKTAA